MRQYLIMIIISLSAVFSSWSSAKPVPVEYYSRLPAIYDAAISPDGNWLATIVDNGGVYILRVFNLVDTSDTKIRASSLEKGVTVNWVSWANNDQLLLSTQQTTKRVGNVFNSGFLFVTDKDVTNMKLVLDPHIDIQAVQRTSIARQFNNRVLDMLPEDPDHILMAFGADDNFNVGVHKMNIKTRKYKRVKRGSLVVQTWVTDLRHEVRVGQGRKDRNGKYQMTIRAADSNKWYDVNEYPGLTAQTKVFGFTKDPNEMLIGSYAGEDTLGLFVYDLVKKKRTQKLFQHDKYDVAGILKSSDGKKVIGVTYVMDKLEKIFFDQESKTRFAHLQSKLEGYQIRIIDQTASGQRVIFKASAPDVPPSLFLYDFAKKELGALGSDYPELGTTLQGDVTAISYTARDGATIPGYVTTPHKIGSGEVALKNQPFIIMPHGGPTVRDTNSYDNMAQYMVSRGYSVLQMNFRGSRGYGKAFESAGRKNWVVMQEDVEDGTRWLIEKGYADPKRVCIVGWSYGGYAALMGAAKNPELYACSASIAGLTDTKKHMLSMKDYRFGRHNAKSFILDGFEDKDDIKENSPAKRAKEFTVPILLVHGEKDATVHYEQYKGMKSALKKSKAKVTTLSFKDGEHSLRNTAHRKELFAKLDRFLRDNLGESAAAP